MFCFIINYSNTMLVLVLAWELRESPNRAGSMGAHTQNQEHKVPSSCLVIGSCPIVILPSFLLLYFLFNALYQKLLKPCCGLAGAEDLELFG